MKKISIIFLSFFLFVSNIYALDIKSNNAVLYNLNEDYILIDKNKDQKASIASLTKLMTAYVAINKINDINEKVKFEKSDYDKLLEQNAQGSSLNKSKEYTYKDLLYGLILESGADCANALARLTFNTEEEFVKQMNNEAKNLKLENTSFANPIGLDDEKNYSSVEDVAKLLKICLKNDVLNEILHTREYTLSDNTKIKHTINWYSEVADIKLDVIKGGKTGYETNSGYALASLAEKDDVNLLLVTTNGHNKYNHVEDAKNIYDYYYNNYSYQTVVFDNIKIASLDTKFLSKKKIDIYPNNDIKLYIENDYNKDDIKLSYEGITTLTLKNKQKEKIGTLKVYYKDKLMKEEDVILKEKLYPDFIIISIASISYILILTLTITIINRIRKQKKALI